MTKAKLPNRPVRTLLVVAALAAFAALVLSAPASAMTKCGQQVLNDWWDNTRVDKTYPLNCYREAIKGLPEDLKQYGQAADDIQRALQIATVDPGGPSSSPPSASPPATTTGAEQPTINGSTDTPGGTDTGGTDTTETVLAAGNTDSDSPSSVPLPLIVLGGLALLLLALGSAGYISRRSQSRRDDPPPPA